MASNASFDISTGADLQEVDNAVNQALKEIAQRYDFKGTHCTIEFDRPKAEIRLAADDEFRMDALLDVLQTRMIKRGVPVKNLELGAIIPAANDTVRREIKLTQGIPQEKAKAIVKAIKDEDKHVYLIAGDKSLANELRDSPYLRDDVFLLEDLIPQARWTRIALRAGPSTSATRPR